MRPVLFRVGRRPVYSYPAMLYLGIVFGTYAQLYAAGRIGLDPSRTLAATLILLTSALVGARALFIAAHWDVYRSHMRRALRFSEGGASMYGGLLSAVPLSAALLPALGIPFGAYWDTATFTILIGMTVTRAGCFMNGCCAGKATRGPLGIHLPDYRGVWSRRYPTQLLEAAWGAIVLASACLLWRRLPFAGGLFLYSVTAYAAGRLVLEATRDERDSLFGVTLHRALSAALVAVSLVAFALAWAR